MITNNLNFIRQQQLKLRAEEYAVLMDYIAQTATDTNLPAGKAVILPLSFQSSPGNKCERYYDSAAVTKFGNPPFFILPHATPSGQKF